MSRKLTPKSTLENLKREAKRWLAALRENDVDARARLERILTDIPDTPALRDVQLAIAREHGLPGWSALKQHLGAPSANVETMSHDDRVMAFLEYACADPILGNGPAAHERRFNAARRILDRHPEIARANIHTAVVCGDVDEVRRILAANPKAAVEPGGPQRRRHLKEREKLWTPLLHLCYGRLPTAAARDNAVDIARLLLDHGANPNDFFEVGSPQNRYTALCGVAGEGEDDAPPHPRRNELAALLFERGAEPYDTQVIYNTHFHCDIVWLLELIYQTSIRLGRAADWDDPAWRMMHLGGYGPSAPFFLSRAVEHNRLDVAEWVLSHGADPNAVPDNTKRRQWNPLHAEAVLRGYADMAALLVRYGATPSTPRALNADPERVLMLSAFALDREACEISFAEHPELLASHRAIFAAARRNRADVVALLLDLGVPIEVEDDTKQRPLHEAASHDAIDVAKLLVERGAELEPVETNWQNTPLGFALYGKLTRMTDYLSQFSRDVWRLTLLGKIDRLREILGEDPNLAKTAEAHATPLMWLPDDDARAAEIVELLLDHGADPSVRAEDGKTAADIAERRGLYGAAKLLR